MAIDPSASPPRQAVEAQLGRILESPVFAKSDRMSRFLRFIVEQTLDGRGGDLKEYSIALAVFDKDDSFDPRIDPTVRSEARRLRAKLADYYALAGPDDRVRIELPKGAYAPLFENVAPAAVKPRTLRRRHIALAAGAIGLVAVAAVAWWLLALKPHPGSRRIAVLPFENLSSDPANEYFSDGLTEEVLNSLANVPEFKVVARTSAFQFKGKHEDIRSIGKKLNVDVVLEGTVRKDGGRIRITPQLINAADGYHMWSNEYDREWKDLFAVQREIATDIVGVLGAKLGHAPPHPVDSDTYALYLEARYQFNKWTPGGMQRAIELFDQTIARDPKYAPAYAGLAASYGLLTAFGSNAVPPDQSRARAKAAALKAIELDPASPDGWVNLGPKLAEEFDWPGAERAFHKGLDLGPNSPDAHAFYAELYLTPMGRLSEALRESQAAAALDPISPYALVGVARRYYFLHQYDSAVAWFQKALDLDARFNLAMGGLVNAYVSKGDPAAARQFLESSKQSWNPRALALQWAKVYSSEGNRDGTMRALAEGSPGTGAACEVAGAYAALGDQEEALGWLDRAVDARSACFQWIPVDPRYDRLHSTAEFAALLRKMRLPVSH